MRLLKRLGYDNDLWDLEEFPLIGKRLPCPCLQDDFETLFEPFLGFLPWYTIAVKLTLKCTSAHTEVQPAV